MRSERHSNAAIATSKRARDQTGHQEIPAAPTVLFGNRNARVALLCQTPPDPGGKLIGALNFCAVGTDFAQSKGKSALVGHLMFFWQFKIHVLAPLSEESVERMRGGIYE